MVQRERPTTERTAPENGQRLEPETVHSVNFLNPVPTLSAQDPVFKSLIDGQWTETQQHSRAVYDYMLRDTSVSNPFDLVLAILKTIDLQFRPQNPSPTDKQKEMAEFLNDQLDRLGMNSTYNSGDTKFITGFFGQGLRYGFSLAEISTKLANWNDRPMVQLRNIKPLPQRSLDGGNLFSNPEITNSNPKNLDNIDYNCFEFSEDQDIVGYVQNRNMQNETAWRGRDRLRILHFTYGTGDGNPFGRSFLWRSYYPWADKYIIERLEQFKLENADSYMTMSYDSDTPMPEVHKQLMDQVAKSGRSLKVLCAPRSDWGTISTISETYSNHIQHRKSELREEIAMGMMVPQAVFTETEEGDIDSRNLIKIFLKFTLPSIIQEITNVLTWQLGKRLIDTNYSHLEPNDYPVCRAQVQLDNDLRVMAPLLQHLISYIDSDRLGEFTEEMLPGMQREWIPDTHEESVAVQRPLDTFEPEGVDAPIPPPKEPGETRQRTDGETENPSQTTDTVA